MRPPATTFESIELVALRTPQRIALIENGQQCTYGDFYHHLLRMTRLLHRMGMQRGERVAVSRPNLQIQLLLLIACENLGAVTTAFAGEHDPDVQPLLGLVDWVLSETPQHSPAGGRVCLVDAAFLQRVTQIDPYDESPCPRVALELHEPQRLSRTSGSSGKPRFMVLSRQAHEYWIRMGAENGGYTSESRVLLDGPLVINATWTRACACLRMGATLLSLPARIVPDADITHIWALPMRLSQLLDALPPDYVSTRPVQIGTGGGFVSPKLQQRAQHVFGSRVVSGYGANESAGISADLDASGEGLLTAGVDVRILDALGRDLPDGEVGVIAVRTPAMVQGYEGDPQATQEAFRDGWFVTGDLGAIVGPRKLRLAGRHDDLLNLGGIKIAASMVEAQIREALAVRDCAVLAVHLDAGATLIGIALAVDPATPQAPLMRTLEDVLKFGAGVSARVIFVPELPRMISGKVDRIGLHRLFRDASPRESLN